MVIGRLNAIGIKMRMYAIDYIAIHFVADDINELLPEDARSAL